MKKLLIGLALIILAAGIWAYNNKSTLLLFYVSQQSQREIGPNVPIDWQQGPDSNPQSAAERPPNIIFILADDLGINDISAFGGGVAGGAVPTPSIDALANEGVMFTQAYAGHSTCAPSRMTGRYPTRTGFEFTPTPPGFGRMVGMVGNELKEKSGSALPSNEYHAEREAGQPEFSSKGLPTEEVTIAEVLADNGYHTVHIGKWHLGTENGMAANDQGFAESLLMNGVLFGEEDDPEIVNAKLDFDSIDQFLWASGQFETSFNGGDSFKPGGYLTDYWTDESLKVIEANKNRPFFLYLAHWGVHTPLQATKADYAAVGDIKPHRLRVYAAMVRALDRSVRRIEEKLEAEGLADNTIIVFSSDNGGAGYIGLPEVNAPYRGWKITFFEGGIRAPMFIKWPDKIKPGTRVVLPLAQGTGVVERKNDALFWQAGYTRVVRAGDWKLQVEGRRNKHWLYNLAEDPTEQVNLAETRTDKLETLIALLDEHQADSRGPLYEYTTENPIAIDKTVADKISPEDAYVYIPN